MRFALPLTLIYLAFLSTPLSAQTWRSALYPEDWTPAYTDEQGRFLHDFSYAGYHAGADPIPDLPGPRLDVTQAPYNADPSGQRDSTAAIQQALDTAKKAGGGVVYLPAGTYRIAPPPEEKVALRLQGDGVVLRGAGAGKTFLFNDTNQMRGKTVLRLAADNIADWHKEGPGIPSSLLRADVENRARQVRADPSGFSVGDLIVLRSDLTQRFIDSVGMTGKWKPAGAMSPNRTLIFCRRITEIDVNQGVITLDVPVRYPLKMADNARIVKFPGRMIREAGVEDLSIGMKQHPDSRVEENDYNTEGTAAYDLHGSMALAVQYAENCWIRRVGTYAPPGNDAHIHIASNMLNLNRSRQVTISECDLRFVQSKAGGGNGYLYTLQGQENLIIRCYAEGARHNYDFGTMYCSGNVISQSYSKDGRLGSDFHMFLSMSNLLDNMTCDGDFLEARHYRPWGGNPIHGVTTTQSVFWNTVGKRYSKEKTVLVLSHQEGEGYVIGTSGPDAKIDSSDFTEGEGRGADLQPVSLYQDQLRRRLARP